MHFCVCGGGSTKNFGALQTAFSCAALSHLGILDVVKDHHVFNPFVCPIFELGQNIWLGSF